MAEIPFRFPLSVSANHRYLVDQDGQPFLIHGDAAWSLITALTKQEAEQYLSDRATRGFNSIIVNLIEHKFNGPLTRSGDHPFDDPVDLSTINPRYFEYAAQIIEQAAMLGIVVFLAPAFLGYTNPLYDEGWFFELKKSGPGKCYQYGSHLGRLFNRFNNIIWLIGCDRNSSGIEEEINSMVMGIKEFDQHNLFTAQSKSEDATPDWYGGPSQGGWLDLNTTYSYQIVHKQVLKNYNRKPVMPFVLIESTYEGEHNSTPVQIRRQAYWALLNGACGQFMGNNPIWLFNPGWQSALDLEGSQSLSHLKSFFSSSPWNTLIPDQNHEIVIQGLGEQNGLDTLAAAQTEDGSCLLVYLPDSREITINLTKMNGSRVSAWWFNPRNGQSELAGEFPASGVQSFTPVDKGDWCLRIDTVEIKETPQ